MKRTLEMQRQSKHAFTLVELLVVIGIIALLAAILLPAINTVMKKYEIAQAQSDMANIITAINNYRNEYNRMPVPYAWLSATTGQHTDFTFMGMGFTTGTEQYYLMNILRGIDKANNPRGIVFLEIPESAIGTDSSGNRGYYVDPWGAPYAVVMDLDFDGRVFFSFNGGTGASPLTNVMAYGHQVAVQSRGDGKSAKSVIKSWEK